jgi:NAD-dependent SIR2 family protein deacetylase
MYNEKFLRYQPTRDIIFILGAGASNPDGVPLQKELLPIIISGKNSEIETSEIGGIVTDFIKENFELDLEKNEYPALESVFGFLDYFLQQNESLSAKYTLEKIRYIKEYLIKLIYHVVNLRTNKSSPHYHKFWKEITRYSANSSIITLNYDTLLEQAFDFVFKNRLGFIDYCIPFMNYEKLPQLHKYNFWINPREPINIDSEINPNLFKIIKIHGSLNWKYCNCCNQTLLTPWDRKIDLNHGKFLGYSYPDNEEYEYSCPIDGTEFLTLIMPPSHLKSLTHPVITHLLREASMEIRTTKKLVFIGYSLSDADIHVKALFKKNISDQAEVIVINPKKNDSHELNYKSLAKNVTFIYSSFEELFENETVLSKIFS